MLPYWLNATSVLIANLHIFKFERFQMAYVFNYYSAAKVSDTIVAASSPYDGIFNNILIGSRGSDIFYAEAGAGIHNQMHGLRGDDVFYGATGANNYNNYVGGAWS